MAKINQAGMKMAGMDDPKYYTKQPVAKPVPKKMAPTKLAARKKTMISNAASKVMGGLYSK